jgi:hypothetical protein
MLSSSAESIDLDERYDTRCSSNNNNDSHKNPYGLSVRRVRPQVETSLPIPSITTASSNNNNINNNNNNSNNNVQMTCHHNGNNNKSNKNSGGGNNKNNNNNNSSSNSSLHKSLPPLFYYMEIGDFRRAAERAKNHPREVRTWAYIKIKSSSIGQHSTKRLALHQACFKVCIVYICIYICVGMVVGVEIVPDS